MEESMKKPVMIGVIVVCLAVAVWVTFFKGSGGGGLDTIAAGDTQWVKCSNPTCKVTYEMNKREYFQELEKNINPNPMSTVRPRLTCKECEKKSLFGAIKCTNPDCGSVFVEGASGPDDHPDRCPDCGRSETQDSRDRRKAAAEGAE